MSAAPTAHEWAALAPKQIVLARDPATDAWLAGPGAHPHGPFVTAAQRVLRRFASDFDANAWLRTHSLHLVGRTSFETLLGVEPGGVLGGRLLDVGAGTGEVTSELAPLFDEVVTTEVSRGMERSLLLRGLVCMRVDLAHDEPPGLGLFRVVSLLNVLDRAPRPATLLDRALAHLEPEGALLISSPLPMRPHVQGPGTTREPDEWISGRAETFSDALSEFVSGELTPRGLVVERWARTLYRSQGDISCPLYALESALVVARRVRA